MPKRSTSYSATPKQILLFTDGASRGNPGPSACGFVIYDQKGTTLVEEGVYLGTTTNNVAEYQGVIHGLEKCLELKPSSVTVKSDSQLLVRQLNGEYRVKAPQIKPLFQKVQALTRRFEEIIFIHVPREENGIADKLANKALDNLTLLIR